MAFVLFLLLFYIQFSTQTSTEQIPIVSLIGYVGHILKHDLVRDFTSVDCHVSSVKIIDFESGRNEIPDWLVRDESMNLIGLPNELHKSKYVVMLFGTNIGYYIKLCHTYILDIDIQVYNIHNILTNLHPNISVPGKVNENLLSCLNSSQVHVLTFTLNFRKEISVANLISKAYKLSSILNLEHSLVQILPADSVHAFYKQLQSLSMHAANTIRDVDDKYGYVFSWPLSCRSTTAEHRRMLYRRSLNEDIESSTQLKLSSWHLTSGQHSRTKRDIVVVFFGSISALIGTPVESSSEVVFATASSEILQTNSIFVTSSYKSSISNNSESVNNSTKVIGSVTILPSVISSSEVTPAESISTKQKSFSNVYSTKLFTSMLKTDTVHSVQPTTFLGNISKSSKFISKRTIMITNASLATSMSVFPVASSMFRTNIKTTSVIKTLSSVALKLSSTVSNVNSSFAVVNNVSKSLYFTNSIKFSLFSSETLNKSTNATMVVSAATTRLPHFSSTLSKTTIITKRTNLSTLHSANVTYQLTETVPLSTLLLTISSSLPSYKSMSSLNYSMPSTLQNTMFTSVIHSMHTHSSVYSSYPMLNSSSMYYRSINTGNVSNSSIDVYSPSVSQFQNSTVYTLIPVTISTTITAGRSIVYSSYNQSSHVTRSNTGMISYVTTLSSSYLLPSVSNASQMSTVLFSVVDSSSSFSSYIISTQDLPNSTSQLYSKYVFTSINVSRSRYPSQTLVATTLSTLLTNASIVEVSTFQSSVFATQSNVHTQKVTSILFTNSSYEVSYTTNNASFSTNLITKTSLVMPTSSSLQSSELFNKSSTRLDFTVATSFSMSNLLLPTISSFVQQSSAYWSNNSMYASYKNTGSFTTTTTTAVESSYRILSSSVKSSWMKTTTDVSSFTNSMIFRSSSVNQSFSIPMDKSSLIPSRKLASTSAIRSSPLILSIVVTNSSIVSSRLSTTVIPYVTRSSSLMSSVKRLSSVILNSERSSILSFKISSTVYPITTRSSTLTSSVINLITVLPRVTVSSTIVASVTISSSVMPKVTRSLVPSVISSFTVLPRVTGSSTIVASVTRSSSVMPSVTGSSTVKSSVTGPASSTAWSSRIRRSVLSSSSTLYSSSTGVVSSTIKKPDTPPYVLKSIGYKFADTGRIFYFRIPENTFYDNEDGGTRNLSLQAYTDSGNLLTSNAWLTFNTTTQTLTGVPMVNDFDRQGSKGVAIRLMAHDKADNFVLNIFHIVIMEPLKALTFVVSLTLKIEYGTFISNKDFRVELMERISRYYGSTKSTDLYIVSIDNGSTIVSWSNTSLGIKTCNFDSIKQVIETIQLPHTDTASKEFADYLMPEFPLIGISSAYLGPCITNVTQVPPITVAIAQDNTKHLYYTIPIIILGIIILIVLIVLLFLRKRRKKMEFFPDGRTYQKGRPVLLPDEIELKSLPGSVRVYEGMPKSYNNAFYDGDEIDGVSSISSSSYSSDEYMQPPLQPPPEYIIPPPYRSPLFRLSSSEV